MPYAADHSAETRNRIVESARRLFNCKGFTEVSIDEIMSGAGLTRGGFYHHFKTKDELYAEAITQVTTCDPANLFGCAGIDFNASAETLMRQLIEAYLSQGHLDSADNQCPLVALPSDVARSSLKVREAYQSVLETMTGVFQRALEGESDSRQKALAIAALCVGGMTLARTIADPELAAEICGAARDRAFDLLPAEVGTRRRRAKVV